AEHAGGGGPGRPGVACAIVARARQAGETIAWVDVDDALEPETVAAAGVVLARLLWVRPRGVPDALRAAEMLLGAGGFGLVALDVGDAGSPGPAPAWPMLARAAERSGTALPVIEPQPQACPFAALGLDL